MQNDQTYFVWDADPVLFYLPEINLPFEISIWGLLLGLILTWAAWQRWAESQNREYAGVPLWKQAGILAGGLLIGQLVMIPFGGPGMESIGPAEPRWYGLMFALSFVFGYLLTFRLMSEGGQAPSDIDRLVIFIVVGTLLFARLGHVIFYELSYYSQHPHLIPAIWRGGVSSHGAAIGILIAMWAFVKQTPGARFLWIADRVVPAVAIGAVLIRIGNFFNSEILGQETDLPWAVIFANVDQIPRHPSMLYEAIVAALLLVLLLTLYYRYRKAPPEGSLFAAFMVVLFSGRFIIEFTKLHHSDFEPALILNMGHWLSVPLVIFGAWLLLYRVEWKRGPVQL